MPNQCDIAVCDLSATWFPVAISLILAHNHECDPFVGWYDAKALDGVPTSSSPCHPKPPRAYFLSVSNLHFPT